MNDINDGVRDMRVTQIIFDRTISDEWLYSHFRANPHIDVYAMITECIARYDDLAVDPLPWSRADALSTWDIGRRLTVFCRNVSTEHHLHVVGDKKSSMALHRRLRA